MPRATTSARRRGAALGLVGALLVGCTGSPSPDPAAPTGPTGTAGSSSVPGAVPGTVPSAVPDTGAARSGTRSAAGSEGASARRPRPATSSAPVLGELADLAGLVEREARAQRRRAGRRGPVLGADLSWPQCPPGLGIPERRTLGAPLPLAAARYVVVGLTNGPAFTENPCLAEQVALVRSTGRLLGAYAVTSFPDPATLAREGARGPYDARTRQGALRNAGVAQARAGVASMRRTGLRTPAVWVDVEPVPDFEWSSDPVANAAVVRGVVEGYRDAGYRVGVYSTPALWREIVGDLRLGLPEWRAAGPTSRAVALSRCAAEADVQGGPPVLAQWVEDRRDQNVTCPGVASDLGRWFSRTGPGAD